MRYSFAFLVVCCALMATARVAMADVLTNLLVPGANLSDQDAEFESTANTAATGQNNATVVSPADLTNGTYITDVLYFNTINGNALPSGYELDAIGTFKVSGINDPTSTGFSNVTLTGSLAVYEITPANTLAGATPVSTILGTGSPADLSAAAQSGTYLFTLTGGVNSTGTTGGITPAGAPATSVPYTLATISELTGPSTGTVALFAGGLMPTDQSLAYTGPALHSISVQTSAWRNTNPNASLGVELTTQTAATITPEPSSMAMFLGLVGMLGVRRVRRRWSA